MRSILRFCPLLFLLACGQGPEPMPEARPGKQPVYIDVHADHLLLESGERVAWEDLKSAGNSVERLILEMEEHRQDRYLLLLIRPGGALPAAKLRAKIHALDGLQSDQDLVYSDEEIDFDARRAKQLALFQFSLLKNAGKPRVFYECRADGRISPIDVAGLSAQADQVLEKFKGQDVNSLAWYGQLEKENVGNDAYRVDMAFHLMGRLALYPRPAWKGHPGNDPGWRKVELDGIDPEEQILSLVVRSSDAAYTTFHAFRDAARKRNLHVTFEVIENDAPIKFGMGAQELMGP